MTKIIADCCANHLGSRRMMEAMIKALACAKVDIAKFQSWRADKLSKDWAAEYDYYKQHELSEADHVFIILTCNKYQIEPLFSVFDLDTVDMLAKLGMKKVKIASPDANSWRLIDKCLDNFDEVIISTGMHTENEKENLWSRYFEQCLPGSQGKHICLMNCVSKYPAKLGELYMPLSYILGDDIYLGYSDHTLGTDAAKLAIALGAEYVEKHFTLDRTYPGKDQAMSGTIEEFKELVDWRDKVEVMIWNPVNGVPDLEARRYIGKWGDNR